MGTSCTQSNSPILLDESPQASPGDQNVSILRDAIAHTVVNEENEEKEENISLSFFLHKLKKKRMTLSVIRDPAKGQEDDEEKHIETLDDFDE